jgi:hypothetical protein
MVKAIPHGTFYGYELERKAIKAGIRKTTCERCRQANYFSNKRHSYVNQLLLARFTRSYPELAKDWRNELQKRALELYPEPGPGGLNEDNDIDESARTTGSSDGN